MELYKSIFNFQYHTKWDMSEILALYPFEKEIYLQLYNDMKKTELDNMTQ